MLKKSLFITSAIFGTLQALLLLATISTITSPTIPFADMLYSALVEVDATITLEMVKSLMQVITLIALGMFVLVAFYTVLCYVLATKKHVHLQKKKLLMVFMVFGMLLTFNIFALVPFLVALSIRKTDRLASDSNPRTQAITKEITSIRNLYSKGAITKAEYDRLVKELFNKIEFQNLDNK